MTHVLSPAQALRDDILAAGLGLKGQTYSLLVNPTNGSTSATDQRATLCAFKAGDVVSKLYIAVATAASVVTAFQMGIADSAGNVLAKSANNGADQTALQTAGIIPINLTQTGGGAGLSSLTIPADGIYYIIGCWTATTGPNVHRSSTPNAAMPNGVKLGVVNGVGTIGTTIGIGTILTVPCWFGWS